ncbi:MAG: adenylyltransferase/cytidyltransferase family protein [Bacteroidales bacterium]|nr:adenylyltransferase/cytidyltransferase family protein [Bacteroidales bacterium]
MKIFRSFEEAGNIRNPVVTTGSFDGVHIGHKTILERLRMLAERHGGESVLITFHPHPRKVLYPDSAGKDLKLISSQEEKLELLRKAGLDNIIIIEFTKDFAKTTSEEFVRDMLHGILNARVVVAGFNHHFGFNQEGDYRQLWDLRSRYGFEAEEIPEQEVQNETVSSTKIRMAISQGNIMRANAYLDHYYIIIGRPALYFYDNRDMQINLCRVPLTEESKLLPAPGIYAVSVESEESRMKGMAIIHRTRDEESEVLLNLFDDEKKIINKRCILFFHKRIHGSVDLCDHGTAATRLARARNEITDLIY